MTLYSAPKLGGLGAIPQDSIFKKTARFVLVFCSISICIIVIGVDFILFPRLVSSLALEHPSETALSLLGVLGALIFGARKLGDLGILPGDSTFKKTARFILAFCPISIFFIGFGLSRVNYSRYHLPPERTEAEIAAENLKRWPAPVLKADLPTYLTYLCQNKHSSCVIDFTASTHCDLVGDDLPLDPGTLSANLDRFTSACTMYQWRKDGDIYLVKPSLPSDSALGVQTGPIRESLSASELIAGLCNRSRLLCVGPDDINVLRPAGAKAQPLREKEPVADYDLPKDTFINNLIRAAKQSGHSYWLVERRPPNPAEVPTGPIFEYRANDLNTTRRYGYYVMPK